MAYEDRGRKIYRIPSKKETQAAEQTAELRRRADEHVQKKARLILLLLSVLALTFVFVVFKGVQTYKKNRVRVPNWDMAPTYREGRGVPLQFGTEKVARGVVVALRAPVGSLDVPPGTVILSRIVATAGQQVEIIAKELYVNGQQVKEPYRRHADNLVQDRDYRIPRDRFEQAWERGDFRNPSVMSVRDNFGPVTVPDGHVFVLGDNRDRAYDSRYFGAIALTDIVGIVR